MSPQSHKGNNRRYLPRSRIQTLKKFADLLACPRLLWVGQGNLPKSRMLPNDVAFISKTCLTQRFLKKLTDLLASPRLPLVAQGNLPMSKMPPNDVTILSTMCLTQRFSWKFAQVSGGDLTDQSTPQIWKKKISVRERGTELAMQ